MLFNVCFEAKNKKKRKKIQKVQIVKDMTVSRNNLNLIQMEKKEKKERNFYSKIIFSGSTVLRAFVLFFAVFFGISCVST